VETISVYYKPIADINGVSYHETLVYTNSAGQSFEVSGGPSQPIPDTFIGKAEQGIQSLANNTSYGTLTANTNVPVDLSARATNFRDQNGNAYQSQVITSGTDLSTVWGQVTDAASYIANQNLNYSLLGTNSNSLANSALVAAGLEVPTDAVGAYGLVVPGDFWTPGAGNLIDGGPTSSNHAFLTGSTASDTATDAHGNTTTSYIDFDSSGVQLDALTYTVSADGLTGNATTSIGAHVASTHSFVTNSDGSQTDSIHGFDTDGNLKFAQTATADIDGSITGSVAAGNQTIDYAASANPIVGLNANGDVDISFTPAPGNESPITLSLGNSGAIATIGDSVFSENLANTQVSIDVVGDISFANGSGNTLQTLAPTSDAGVTQSLYSSSVVDQLTQKNFFGPDGSFNGSVAFAYSPGSDTVPSGGVITNGAGQTIGSYTANSDGRITLVNTDAATGEIILTTTIDADGHTTEQTVNPNTTDYPAFVQAIADTLATQLISSVLIKNNLPATIAAQAFADAVIKSSLAPASANFTQDFAASTFDIAGGIGGSQAGALIADALGLPSEFGTLTGGVTGNLVTQALVNEASNALGITTTSTDVLTAANFAAGIGGAGGVAVGSALAGLLLTPTLAGEVTGAVAAAAALANVAELIDVLAVSNPITAVLTAFSLALGSDFIGNIIGDIFGGLFGGQPSVGPDAGSQNRFDASSGQFFLNSSGADNGGSTDGVNAISNALNNVMNQTVGAIGGTVTNAVPDMTILWFEGNYYFAFGDQSPRAFPNVSSDPNVIVQGAAFAWLHSLQIEGGNAYMSFMMQKSDANNLTDLLGDLNAAHDYSLYIANPIAFDLALAMSGDASQLANWQSELARAQTMGLDRMTVSGTAVTMQSSAATVVADAAALEKMTGFTIQVQFTDTAANTSASMDTLEGLAASGELETVTLTDAGTPTLQLSSLQLLNDLPALGKIAGSFNVDMSQPGVSGPPIEITAGTTIGTGQNMLGSSGQDLVLHASGGETLIWEFNAAGQMVSHEAFTQAVVTNGDGSKVSTLTFQADLWNRTSETDYYDPSGHLTEEVNGYGDHSVANFYNGSGQLTQYVTVYADGAQVSTLPFQNDQWGRSAEIDYSTPSGALAVEVNKFNDGHSTMILWNTHTSFSTSDSSTAAGTINTFLAETNAGDTVTDFAENGLGFGGHDIVLTTPTGQTIYEEIGNSGSILATDVYTMSTVVNGDGSKVNTQTFQSDPWNRASNVDSYNAAGQFTGELTTYTDGHTSLLFNDPQGGGLTFHATLSQINGSTLRNYNGNSDLIDITNLIYDSSIAASPVNWGGGNGEIVVSDHGSTVATIYLQFIQNLSSFTAQSDGAGGTLLIDPPLPDGAASLAAAIPPMPTVGEGGFAPPLLYTSDALGGGTINDAHSASLGPALLMSQYAAAMNQPASSATSDFHSMVSDSLLFPSNPTLGPSSAQAGLHLVS
jgi:hypothetical protein